LPRARDPNRDKAFEIYKKHNGDIDLVEIASQLRVPHGTVRGWKSKDKWEQKLNGTFHKTAERSNKKRTVKKKPIDDGTRETMMNENLTHEQRLFCIYYSKSFNAVQSYVKAYGCDLITANANASRVMGYDRVKKELQRLNEIKRQQIVVNEADMIEYHMRIAFADIGDYLTFGREEVPVMSAFGPVKDDNGNELTKEINTVKLKESNKVDTQLIQEVKQGKDGVSIKLADKHRSMEWLDKYFLMNPLDKHRIDYDIKKQQQDTERSKAQVGLIKSQTDKLTGSDNQDELKKLDEVLAEIKGVV